MKVRSLAAAGALAAACMASAPAAAQGGVGDGTQFLGQLFPFGGNFCPLGFVRADGQLLPISQNSALFSLYGTNFGGDGRTTFGLPDLRGRHPMHLGSGPGLSPKTLGAKGGSESFTLSVATMPAHAHTGGIAANPQPGDSDQPVRNGFAASQDGTAVFTDQPVGSNFLNQGTVRIDNTGSGQSYSKVSPYLAVTWCIADTGIFPSRS